jgi:uncharacterized protein (TIGR03437 family)
MKRSAHVICVAVLATLWSPVGRAQGWDTSGNALLTGNFNFRQIALRVVDSVGNAGETLTLYGSVNFDGNGHYSITGTSVDSASPQPQAFTSSGTYSIAASGYGFLSSPIADGDSVYGLVAGGVFVGSSTEAGFYNDLFVAVKASPGATNAALQGSYVAGYMNMASSSPQLQYDALVKFSPDGQGHLGTVSLNSYQGPALAAVNLTQPGINYTFSNGIGTASFPPSVNLGISGQQLWYVSPDSNFFVGGSASGWDMILAVRRPTSGDFLPTLSGLYYEAGLSRDASQFAAAGSVSLDSSYGSLVAGTDGNIVAHKRSQKFDGTVRDRTYSGTYPPSSGDEYVDASSSTQYSMSKDGRVRIGLGIGPFLGISVAVQAPVFSGSGVYLNPVGLQNSASSAPFTARIARGELILLNGTNLAGTAVVTTVAPFTTSLGGVQVFFNGIAAPIYYVTPGLISAIVPYGITTDIAEIKVVNNGVSSNIITAYVGDTAPGVFTNPPGGISRAIVQHLDYSLVTAENPAHLGETLLGYLTGTGDVSPAVTDGAPGPTAPLSATTNSISLKIDKLPATVGFSGLVPTLSGLYAIVFTVPNGAHSGNLSFEISGPDSTTSEAFLPVSAAPGGPNK